MHSRIVLSFFLTKITGAPQGDTLGRIYFLFINSFSCDFSSLSFKIFIRYKAFELGTAPGTSSIVKSNSLLGGNPGISSGNTSVYSFKIGIFSIFNLSVSVLPSSSIIVAAQALHPFLKALLSCKAESI